MTAPNAEPQSLYDRIGHGRAHIVLSLTHPSVVRALDHEWQNLGDDMELTEAEYQALHSRHMRYRVTRYRQLLAGLEEAPEFGQIRELLAYDDDRIREIGMLLSARLPSTFEAPSGDEYTNPILAEGHVESAPCATPPRRRIG